jgi:hypothetical protein
MPDKELTEPLRVRSLTDDPDRCDLQAVSNIVQSKLGSARRHITLARTKIFQSMAVRIRDSEQADSLLLEATKLLEQL